LSQFIRASAAHERKRKKKRGKRTRERRGDNVCPAGRCYSTTILGDRRGGKKEEGEGRGKGVDFIVAVF